MEAASFLVKVEALDKRRFQLYAAMRLPIEDGKIMLYHEPKWGSCLMDALTAMSNVMRAQKEVTYCNKPKRFHARITGGHARIKRGRKNSY